MLTSWIKGKSGGWEDAGKWTGGVPTAIDDAQIDASGKYTVTISSAVACNSLDIGGSKVTLHEFGNGSLAIGNTGGITIHDGARLELGGVNADLGGYIAVLDGVLQASAAGSLGTASLDLFGGSSFLSTSDLTVTNSFNTATNPNTGDKIVAIAAGDSATLRLATKLQVGADLRIGSKVDDGTVVLASAPGQVAKGHVLDLAGGTLALGSNKAAQLFHNQNHKSLMLRIENGATFDLAGHAAELDSLQAKGGTILSSNGVGNLRIDHAAGSIASEIVGAVVVDLAGQPGSSYDLTGAVLLDGTGVFALESGVRAELHAELDVAAGGFVQLAEQSVLTITDFDIDGGLYIGTQSLLVVEGTGIVHNGIALGSGSNINFHTDGQVLVAGNVTGGGSFQINGSGEVELAGTNSFNDAGSVSEGTLKVTSGAALGTEIISFNAGGTLETLATTSISNRLTLLQCDVAALHGTTLTLNGEIDVVYGDTATFGSAGFDGTILLKPTSASSVDGEFEIQDGTLVLGNATAANMLGEANFVKVDAGATLDLNAQYGVAQELLGSGAIVNNGPAFTYLQVSSGTFGGTIANSIAVSVVGGVTLTGVGGFDSLYIGNDAVATLTAANSERVYMIDGDATLVLGAAANLTGKINSFGSGDVIDLQALHYSTSASLSYDAAHATLTVNDSSHSVTLAFQDAHSLSDFQLAAGADGSVEVHYASSSAAGPDAHLDAATFARALDDATAIHPAHPMLLPHELLAAV